MLASLSNARVTVWGLGAFGGGAAAARHLARHGARVTVTDLKPADQLRDALSSLADLDLRFVLGRHDEADLLDADLVVKSPAVPPTNRLLQALDARGTPVTSEFVLGLHALCERGVPYALVTGSKGKSTTVALAGAMLHPLPRVLAGNNERPLLDALPSLPPDARVVLEASSFMAHDIQRALDRGITFRPPAAVALTSLEPEHLNWHPDLEHYYGAKLALLDLAPDVVAFPDDHPELLARVPARLHPDSQCLQVGAETPEFDASALTLLGPHNLRNARLAAVVAQQLGATSTACAEGAGRFAPLPHRLETVAVSAGGTRYVNDTTATTPAAAMASIEAVPTPVAVLVGGSDKGADMGALAAWAKARAHLVVCVGEIGGALAEAAEAAPGEARVVRVETGGVEGFEEGFRVAAEGCPVGGTVLLAPGTASYDMFANFKARGERFAALARERVAAG